MRYKLNPNRPYKVGCSTQNQQPEIWDGYQPIFANSGEEGAPDWQLHSIDRKYGQGGSRSNTDFFNHCVDSQWIVPVQAQQRPERSRMTLDWKNLNEQIRRIQQRTNEIHMELSAADLDQDRNREVEDTKADLVRLEFAVRPVHAGKIKAYVEMLRGS
jgi:hypothetical protein